MENPKILIVDDRVENLIALEELVSELEVDIVRALSGNEAIAKTLEHDFAIALIDVQMPGMDGFETVDLLRKNKQTKNLPVIFVTASHKEEYYQIKGIEIGAVDFMTKPIVPTVLLGKIRVFLNLYHQRSELTNTVIERDKALHELGDHRDHLEELVRERTAEIEMTNEELKKEIAEHILTEEEREQALVEAQKANSVKDLFLANMSHEIRTPLNSILGFSEIIEQSFQDRMEEQESEYFQIIHNSGQRLIKTVHEILDISRIEAGVMPNNPEVTPLTKLIESLFNEFKPAAAAKNLEFNYDHPINDAIVKVDQPSINKALSNLIDNAIKYTEEGQITIMLNQQNGKYVLSISDTGIGITVDYLDNIYDVFSQESTGYTKKYQGLGLGLSIAKSCLDMNDIPIDVESKQDVGTSFSLTFTPSDTVIAEPETKPRPVDIKVDKTTIKERPVILLVEDDENNRKTLEVILKKNYETPYAVSVETAKKQVGKHNVDLILLDLSLVGDEDGLDFVAYMKTKKQFRNIPIIAVTAHAYNTDRENALNAGCNDYMSKPIDIKILLFKISQLLNESSHVRSKP